MRCPSCGNQDTRVVDSREAEDGTSIRRRRACDRCEARFTTFERSESARIQVLKRDGTRQEFDRRKLASAIEKAASKSLSPEKLGLLIDRYLEVALSLPVLETGGDPSSEICYRRPKGYCVQRTTWIYHLFANDFYLQAIALADRRDHIAALTRANQFATEARKYRGPEGGEGFDQCIHTTPLAEKIAEALDPSRSQNPTGGVQSQAR